MVEAPWMMYRKVNDPKTTSLHVTSSLTYQGYYYLFYASGWYFEAKYHMRVAKAKHPTGPFIKRNYPVLETDWKQYGSGLNTTWVGPGHGSVLEVGGSWWMFYHAWSWGSLARQDRGRQLLLDRISWRRGWPVVGSPSVEERPAPTLTAE